MQCSRLLVRLRKAIPLGTLGSAGTVPHLLYGKVSSFVQARPAVTAGAAVFVCTSVALYSDAGEVGSEGQCAQAKSPLDKLQALLDKGGIPLNVASNFVRNALSISGIVMYWSAGWNLLNRYFLVKSVPNPVANSLLRIALGVAILMFDDNDIKELGDRWEGIKGNNTQADHAKEERKEGSHKAMAHGDNEDLQKNQMMMEIWRSRILWLSPVNEAHRANDVEKWVRRNAGLQINLHNHFLHNFMLGNGIIITWSGLETFYNATFFRTQIPNVTANNLLRIFVAMGILYFVSGDLNDMGDGFLEEEPEQ